MLLSAYPALESVGVGLVMGRVKGKALELEGVGWVQEVEAELEQVQGVEQGEVELPVELFVQL